MSLADCTVGVSHRVTRVLDQEPEFLQFADRQGLTPGATVAVQKREAAAEAVRIRIGRREEVSLGLAAAAKILVESPPAKLR
jgi:Fe2+ transport system protein FeoA